MGKILNKKIEQLEQKINDRKENTIQLPLWPENKRGVPNVILRSALFPAIQSRDRKYLKQVEIFSQQGIKIIFTGEQFNQEDLTIWQTLVHLVKNQPLGSECVFSARSILKSLGLPTSGNQHKTLHSSIIRLMACAISITRDGKTYGGSLIEEIMKDEITDFYRIKLNKKMIMLYSENQYTQINWEQRIALRKKPLALALHAFYSSHRKPYPQKIETLSLLLGNQNKQKADFKRKIQAALSWLEKIRFLSDKCEIKKGVVFVERI